MKNAPSNLSNLKSKVGKLDPDKLVPVTVDLIKLSDVVKNDVIKNTEYNELVKKVNNINTTDTGNLVKKKLTITQKITELEKKDCDHDQSNNYITTQEFNKLTSRFCFKISTSKSSKQK